ncbi:hypothetical protein HZA85_01805 [Candidatus Uhrbacteria bacterium]|nr:hypothetical protein [Candidatus Uhrbacteria bacterium]
MNTCTNCKHLVEEWNRICRQCGYHLVLEPEADVRARYLRGPSLGALLFTQVWSAGARLYVWFLISLVPGVGLVALFACLFWGRRWSWKSGGWQSWEAFTKRMRLLDLLGLCWVLILVGFYLFRRFA